MSDKKRLYDGGDKKMTERERPAYYAVLTADVRYDKRLKPAEKILFAEITALSTVSGYCYASNSYFCDLYGVSIASVKGWISDLKRYGYVDVEVIRDASNNVIERKIRPISTPSAKNLAEGSSENLAETSAKNLAAPRSKNWPDNIKSRNTTSKNTIQRESRPESVEVVRAYCQERNNGVNPEAFFNYYEANGWKVGRNPMKDWKAAVRNWETKDGRGPRPKGGTQSNGTMFADSFV